LSSSKEVYAGRARLTSGLCGERREDGGDWGRRLADGRREPAGMPALGKTKRLKMECEMENVSSP
jgi:hypothetical protein